MEFSSLESIVEKVFFQLSNLAKIPKEFAQDYYYRLDEEKRNEAMLRVADLALDDPTVIDFIKHIVECLIWCRDARNQILHSEYYQSILDVLDVDFVPNTITLMKRKSKRSQDMHYFNFTVPQVQCIADFMHETGGIVVHVSMYILFLKKPRSKVPTGFREYTTLPAKLTIPRRLHRTESPVLPIT